LLPKKEKDGKKCRPCGENRLIEFFFKQFIGKRKAAVRCLQESIERFILPLE
jgi:hypothetical protein